MILLYYLEFFSLCSLHKEMNLDISLNQPVIWEVNIVRVIIYFIFNQIFITLDYLYRPYVLFVKLSICILDYLLLFHLPPWVT